SEARPAFEQALELSPERDRSRASALIGLGDTESNSGRFQPGIARLREALALRDLGSTYAQAGDFSSALTTLRRALRLLETDPGMRIQYAGTLVSLGAIYSAENKLGLAE